MCFRSKTKLVAAALAAATLGGCSSSEIYLDRRDYVSLASGDAQATNRVAHMIDPWPKASSNNRIAYSGEKMQTAHERYRTGRIIAPVNATTSSVAYSQAQQQAQTASNTQSSSAPSSSTNKP